MQVDSIVLDLYTSILDPTPVTYCDLMNCHTTHVSNGRVDLLDKLVAQQNIVQIMPFPSNLLVQANRKFMFITFITNKRTQQQLDYNYLDEFMKVRNLILPINTELPSNIKCHGHTTHAKEIQMDT